MQSAPKRSCSVATLIILLRLQHLSVTLTMVSGARAGHKLSQTSSTGHYDLVQPLLLTLVPPQVTEVQVNQD